MSRNRQTSFEPVRWNSRGEATGDLRGKAVPVWQGIPGERAKVELVRGSRGRLKARWMAAEGSPHPHRQDPPCPHYEPCGGCPWMHLDAEGQAEGRRQLVAEAFRTAGVSPVSTQGENPEDLLAPGRFRLRATPCPMAGFRNFARLEVGRSGAGHVKVGNRGREARGVVPVPECRVVTPGIRRVMKSLAHHVVQLGLMPWRPGAGGGLLRWVLLRQSRLNGRIVMVLVAGGGYRICSDLVWSVADECSELETAWVHFNRQKTNATFDLEESDEPGFTRIMGGDPLMEELAGIRLRVGPGDYFRNNPSAAEQLYRELEGALLPNRPLLDVHCGVGGTTLVGARRTGFALGLGSSPSTVELARMSASRADLPAEFSPLPVEEALDRVATRLARAHPNVLLDPPWRGPSPATTAGILALKPARLLLTSRNTRSLIRDLQPFLDAGYRLRDLVPIDSAPHTPHLELLAVADPPEAPPPGRRPRRVRVRPDHGEDA